MPYHPLSLFSKIAETNPFGYVAFQKFYRGTDGSERKVMPSITPDNFIDLYPRDETGLFMIEVVNLHKKFGKFSALSNINLVLGTGQCVALVGPNGCGKTTPHQSILGLVVPQQGQILIDGQSIIHQHSHRAKLGYMPQIGRYPGNLTIGQLINMVRNLRPHQNHYDEELIDLLGIHAILSKRCRPYRAVPSKK